MLTIFRMNVNGTCCIVEDFDLINSTVQNLDIGDKFELELVEMTEEEYNNLPEFEGF